MMPSCFLTIRRPSQYILVYLKKANYESGSRKNTARDFNRREIVTGDFSFLITFINRFCKSRLAYIFLYLYITFNYLSTDMKFWD